MEQIEAIGAAVFTIMRNMNRTWLFGKFEDATGGVQLICIRVEQDTNRSDFRKKCGMILTNRVIQIRLLILPVIKIYNNRWIDSIIYKLCGHRSVKNGKQS